MGRLVGWFLVGAYTAWSIAALIVSGAEAAGLLVASAVACALMYGAAPHLQAETRRIRRFQQTSAPARRRSGAHLHGTESFRQP